MHQGDCPCQPWLHILGNKSQSCNSVCCLMCALYSTPVLFQEGLRINIWGYSHQKVFLLFFKCWPSWPSCCIDHLAKYCYMDHLCRQSCCIYHLDCLVVLTILAILLYWPSWAYCCIDHLNHIVIFIILTIFLYWASRAYYCIDHFD